MTGQIWDTGGDSGQYRKTLVLEEYRNNGGYGLNMYLSATKTSFSPQNGLSG